MTGCSSASRNRMRATELVSLSAQCTMTSCADHFPGAGRHCIASAGTFFRAALRWAGPRAYRSMSAARSAAVSATSWLLEQVAPHQRHRQNGEQTQGQFELQQGHGAPGRDPGQTLGEAAEDGLEVQRRDE